MAVGRPDRASVVTRLLRRLLGLRSPDVVELARVAYEAVRALDRADGRPSPEWEDLHAANRRRYLAIADALLRASW